VGDYRLRGIGGSLARDAVRHADALGVTPLSLSEMRCTSGGEKMRPLQWRSFFYLLRMNRSPMVAMITGSAAFVAGAGLSHALWMTLAGWCLAVGGFSLDFYRRPRAGPQGPRVELRHNPLADGTLPLPQGWPFRSRSWRPALPSWCGSAHPRFFSGESSWRYRRAGFPLVRDAPDPRADLGAASRTLCADGWHGGHPDAGLWLLAGCFSLPCSADGG
jgi:hypothetical protein